MMKKKGADYSFLMLSFILACFPILLLETVFLTYIAVNKRYVEVGMGYNVWFTMDWENDTNCIDKPVLGYYKSNNVSILLQHIKWFDELGIDFVIVNWQGIYYNPPCNENAQLFFQVLANYTGKNKIKACICVQITGNWTDETEIYGYVWDNFVTRYYPVYHHYQGKPLILFFSECSTIYNSTDPLKKDSRFTVISMGVKSYDDWLYNAIYYPERADENSWCAVKNWEGDSPRCRHIPVTPRFDERHIGYISDRPPSIGYYVDPELTWLYDAEWEKALKAVKENQVDVITISWWNEFAERSQIEPCYDATAKSADPYFIFNKTKYYISRLREETLMLDYWHLKVCATILTPAIFWAVLMRKRVQII
ncbi:MAG: hypothetical protein QXU99_07995 [Candidatus Bathyarchaeia archaeon]